MSNPALAKSETKPAGEAAALQRLDLWLWAARWFKTRSIAQKRIEAGRVLLAGERVKPAKTISTGAQLQIVRDDEERYHISVLGLSAQRLNATQAVALFHEPTEQQQARLRAREEKRLARTGYQPPPTKPDKQARRALAKWREQDQISVSDADHATR